MYHRSSDKRGDVRGKLLFALPCHQSSGSRTVVSEYQRGEVSTSSVTSESHTMFTETREIGLTFAWANSDKVKGKLFPVLFSVGSNSSTLLLCPSYIHLPVTLHLPFLTLLFLSFNAGTLSTAVTSLLISSTLLAFANSSHIFKNCLASHTVYPRK